MTKNTYTTFYNAKELLRDAGTKLVKMHALTVEGSPRNVEYHLWPRGGRIPADIAAKLIALPDMQPLDSGLIDGCPQSWAIRRTA